MSSKFFLIAGVASIALATPADAQRDRGDARERAQASQSERKAQRPARAERQKADRPQRAERQRTQRAERPKVERQRIQRAERPRIERQQIQRAERPRVERQRIERAERPRVERQRVQRAEQRIERQRIQRAERPRVERQRIERAERPRVERQRVQRAEQRIERQRIERAESRSAERIDRRRASNREANLIQRQALREDRRDLRERVSRDSVRRFVPRYSERSWRPMKASRDRRIVDIGQRIDPVRYSSYVPQFYRTRYVDTPRYYYRYDDDLAYLYRIDRDRDFVRALIPIFGGYGYGDPWPNMYNSSFVPLGYQNYYYDTPDYYYRNDGYGIYRIDAGTQLIAGLVALLTGQTFGIGQMLPASYSAYNVPFAYRSTYFDRDDAWYRYGDGFIYEVDPYTRRIEDRYPVYGSGYDYMVGQPWPVAYPGYNVPYGYQSLYYDTPQYHYRYANGGIYQVDPTTQVIRALVALVSGQQFGIGQALPTTYSAYNVPFAYRDRYFDSDDDWYRYANGFIYRVDPRSGLIEEAVPVYA